MIRTVEATIDARGVVRLLEPISLIGTKRALVMILEEEPAILKDEAAILSESALSDWNRPEEEAAWAHLQPFSSSGPILVLTPGSR